MSSEVVSGLLWAAQPWPLIWTLIAGAAVLTVVGILLLVRNR